MKALAATILLLLPATISASLEVNGVYPGARAKSSSAVQQTDGLCSELVCSTTDMTLIIEVAELKKRNIDIPNIHLKYCAPITYDDKIVTIKWPLGSTQCGNELTTTPTEITYRNYVYLPPDPAAIIYREELILIVSCTYPRYLNGSNDQILIPTISPTYIDIPSIGKFQLKMTIYQDNAFTIPYTTPEITISTKSNLYVGLHIVDDDVSNAIKEFRLLMINCYSTPTDNMYDPLQYYIISNRCPNPSDTTIHVVENGISTRGKFYIQMFKFITRNNIVYDAIYLHCQVYLCDGVCSPTCPISARSSSDTPQPQTTLTIGPIRLSDNDVVTNPDNNAGTVAGFSILTVIGVILMNIFVV